MAEKAHSGSGENSRNDCGKETENDNKVVAKESLEESNDKLEIDKELVSSSIENRGNKCSEDTKNDTKDFKEGSDEVSSSSSSARAKKTRARSRRTKKANDTEVEKAKDESNLGDQKDLKEDKVSDSKPLTRESLKSKLLQNNNAKEDKYQHEKDKFLNMEPDEKRKLYKCRKFKTLDQIETWPVYYAENKYYLETKFKVKKDKKFTVNDDLNSKISVIRDDITSFEIDAIVNAANESLLGGGGVDGAIHSAAGNYLVKECATLSCCKAGEAKITGGYKLPAKYVIHTVGPRGENPNRLTECYLNSLNRMKENNLRSIAFPCISTGIFGYPNLNAANVALETVRQWLEEGDNSKNVDRIIFCLFLPKDVDIYNERLQVYFPLHDSTVSAAEETKPTAGTAHEPTAGIAHEPTPGTAHEPTSGTVHEPTSGTVHEPTSDTVHELTAGLSDNDQKETTL